MTQNAQISVTLTPQTRLKHALKQTSIKDPALVTHLTIVGTFSNSDMRYIRENMAKTLQELDLSHAVFKKTNFRKGLLKVVPP